MKRQPKECFITFRCTKEERELIEINAINQRLSTSQYLRTKALENE